MIIDLADLQWWQGVVAILGALGLSPAPWILGLALNRIQFTKPAQAAFDARVADLKSQHTQSVTDLVAFHADQLSQRDERNGELKTSLAKMEEARNLERSRADDATAMLGRAVEAVEVSNHLLESLGEAAETKGTK